MRIGWGIDVGVGSLGFAVVELDEAGNPLALLDGVSHVYPVPEGGVDRRGFRSMRHQTDRRRYRLRRLRKALCSTLDIPLDFDTTPPDLPKDQRKQLVNGGLSRARLRALGITETLAPEDLARAIMHIARNRGRRLSRGLGPKDTDGEETTGGKGQKSLVDRAKDTLVDLEVLGIRLMGEGRGPATPGQLAHEDEIQGKPTRASRRNANQRVYTRTMMESELDRLLTRQAQDHRAFAEEAIRRQVQDLVFEEMPMKAPRIGRCRYGITDMEGAVEQRLPIASDLFQTKRILEEVNNLCMMTDPRTGGRVPPSLEQRDAVAALAFAGTDVSASAARQAMGLGRGADAPILSLEVSGGRTKRLIKGHALVALAKKAEVADLWSKLDEGARRRLETLLREEDDHEVVVRALLSDFGLTGEQADALSKAPPPRGYGSAGATATARLVEVLRGRVCSIDKAEEDAGLTDSLTGSMEPRDRLPYYGEILPEACVPDAKTSDRAPRTEEERYGRIPNPVVHVALNRIRHIANDYLKRYGNPVRIGLELARDLNKSAEDRAEIERDNAKNQKQNDARAKDLVMAGLDPTRGRLRMVRLWEWQGKVCLYSGKTISMEDLTEGRVEVDHILPEARTMDGRMGNLALCFREMNARKGRQTPHEAFYPTFLGLNGESLDFPNLLKRVKDTRPGSLWRFREDAMERFKDEGYFQDRYLNDTRYVGKLARRYLRPLVPGEPDVLCLTGGLSDLLRRAWGLKGIIRDIMVEEGRLDPTLFQDAGEIPADDAARATYAEGLNKAVAARKKIRWDDRHHLLDAIVAACATRSDVQRIATLTGRGEDWDSAVRALSDLRRADRDRRDAGFCWTPAFAGTVKDFLTTLSPDQPTRVTLRPDHDPMGQLHQQTQLGVICENPDRPGLFLTLTHVDLSKLAVPCTSRADFEAKLKQTLGLSEEHVALLERVIDQGAPVWWGGTRPDLDLRNLGHSLDGLRETLLAAWDAVPAVDDSGKTKSATVRTKEAVAQVEQDGIRRFKRVNHQSARVLSWRSDKRGRRVPDRVFVTKSNAELVVFITGAGDRAVEVIQTIDAVNPDFDRAAAVGAETILFVIRQGDVLEMDRTKDPENGRDLYRVRSFSGGAGSLDLECLPIAESRAPKEVPSDIRQRFNSVSAFLHRAPLPVHLTPTGYLKWKPPLGNRPGRD
ncbi:MAG: hypothetical protein K9H25_23505 [Rhodospirillum sp.]|nr:hypothetical protein [Rhodospirillum sp.]MCF8492101.1 hypothetical protein [Rhodospirillum sp.]MCF8502083.1 hypothetical protein [Rhodospirillum sp.]